MLGRNGGLIDSYNVSARNVPGTFWLILPFNGVLMAHTVAKLPHALLQALSPAACWQFTSDLTMCVRHMSDSEPVNLLAVQISAVPGSMLFCAASLVQLAAVPAGPPQCAWLWPELAHFRESACLPQHCAGAPVAVPLWPGVPASSVPKSPHCTQRCTVLMMWTLFEHLSQQQGLALCKSACGPSYALVLSSPTHILEW